MSWNAIRSGGTWVTPGSGWTNGTRLSFSSRKSIVSGKPLVSLDPLDTSHTLLSFLAGES